MSRENPTLIEKAQIAIAEWRKGGHAGLPTIRMSSATQDQLWQDMGKPQNVGRPMDRVIFDDSLAFGEIKVE
jgi:hypothetical protein